MKRTSIICILCFILSNLIGQNLVKNPSFEEYWYCPHVANYDTFPCKYWLTPNSGTSDYFNSCSGDFYFSVPDNELGNNPAHFGNAYVGIIIYNTNFGSIEHIQGEFTNQLTKNQKYKVSFFVKFPYLASEYSTYKIGAFISKNRILTGWLQGDNYLYNAKFRLAASSFYNEIITPNFKAQIENPVGKFIEEENTWIEINGIYTAKGGEKFITIGMFWQDDTKSNKFYEKYFKADPYKYKKLLNEHFKKKVFHYNPKKRVENSKSFYFDCYYFIDDVSVIPLDSAGNEMQTPINK